MTDNMGAPLRETGSRASMEPASSLHPSGFDPARVRALAAKAQPLLECGHRGTRPNDRVQGERIVGFIIDQDLIGLGLSEPLFALDAVVELARTAIAMEARQGGDGATRLHPEDDSAGPKDIAQGPHHD